MKIKISKDGTIINDDNDVVISDKSLISEDGTIISSAIASEPVTTPSRTKFQPPVSPFEDSPNTLPQAEESVHETYTETVPIPNKRRRSPDPRLIDMEYELTVLRDKAQKNKSWLYIMLCLIFLALSVTANPVFLITFFISLRICTKCLFEKSKFNTEIQELQSKINSIKRQGD